jgi:hypothetical protein
MLRAAVTALLLALGLTANASAASRITVADPSGGARWSARQTTSDSGRTCVTLARGSDRRGTSCARLSTRIVFSYDVRTENARRPRAVRTIFVATFAPQVVRASLRTPDGTRTYRRRSGRPRVLLVVLAGRVERQRLTATVRRGAQIDVIHSGLEPAAQVADPLGGPAWRSRAAEGRGACVVWERVPPRYAATPDPSHGSPRCGDADADVPVAAAEEADGRLVVFGLAGAAVRSAVVRLPDGSTRTLALEPSTRALLAVLPAGVDPAALRLVARTGDGREVERPLDVVG